MKRIAFAACLAFLATPAFAGDAGRDITVSKAQFSPLYPAMWFSPSTGEIAPLREKSAVPPEPKYEIWIEPSDPEFAFPKDKSPGAKSPADVGFVLLGKGPAVFANPEIPTDPKLQRKLNGEMRDALEGTGRKSSGAAGSTRTRVKIKEADQMVFYCQGKKSGSLIAITEIDTEGQTIAFRWKPLGSRK